MEPVRLVCAEATLSWFIELVDGIWTCSRRRRRLMRRSRSDMDLGLRSAVLSGLDGGVTLQSGLVGRGVVLMVFERKGVRGPLKARATGRGRGFG